jgi:predicted GH43/DUF377 family glycosyl hydrolase
MSMDLSRREFGVLGSFALGASLWGQCSPDRLATPHKLGKLVLTASSEQGQYDSISVDCPFVFTHESRFYMTFVGFDGVGYQTGLASSSNLIDWKKEGAILKRDPSSATLKYNVALTWIMRENGLYSPGALKQLDGHFVAAYHAYPSQGYEQGAAIIGLARSRDLHNWVCGAPVLRPEDGAAWEHGGLYKACLLESAGTYYLFYNAKNQTEGPWHEQTGVVTSKDLKTWKRYEGNPVIPNGPAGSMDEKFASDPCVLQDGQRWAYFYFGLDAKGVARDMVAAGPDLMHAAKCQGVLIDVGPPGSVDSAYAHKPSMIAWKGDLYHFYCAVSRVNGKEVRGISVARSRAWS